MNDAPAYHHWGHEFGDPAFGSQQTFRAVFTAMEHPGQIVAIRQDPYAPAIWRSSPKVTGMESAAWPLPWKSLRSVRWY